VGVLMSPTGIDPAAIGRARRLRRGMTDSERKLWSQLREFRRHYGIHVRRQVPIGSYIADFAIHEAKLVIEVDGEFHYRPSRLMADVERDRWLAGEGYRVLRFNTGEISGSLDGCIEEILRALSLVEPPATPTTNPSPQGGGRCL
jgi:very-short-patch-repair endonuclease